MNEKLVNFGWLFRHMGLASLSRPQRASWASFNNVVEVFIPGTVGPLDDQLRILAGWVANPVLAKENSLLSC